MVPKKGNRIQKNATVTAASIRRSVSGAETAGEASGESACGSLEVDSTGAAGSDGEAGVAGVVMVTAGSVVARRVSRCSPAHPDVVRWTRPCIRTIRA